MYQKIRHHEPDLNNMEKQIGILIADLSGYSALTDIHGAKAAVKVIERYVTIARSSLIGNSHLIERAGDQLIIISNKADDLAKTAITLEQNTEAEPHFLSIHAGLHFGSVIEHNGHYYGSTINLAARISTKAKENKILCSQDFMNALIAPCEFSFVPQGNIRFKNILESKAIYELLPKTITNTKFQFDPVCHMHLDDHELSISLINGEEEYFFCSDECKKKYQAAYSHLTNLVA